MMYIFTYIHIRIYRIYIGYIYHISHIYIYHNIEFILQGPCPRRKRAAARRAAKEGKADANASVEGGEGGMAGWWFEPAKIVTI
jgi:hypothetical protein